MQHAHDKGVLHRDLKPSNILLEPPRAGGEPVPRIADFGLAKLLEQEEESTRSGAILGTPCYMAPEQAEGRIGDVGPVTDVYALGAILYEILTDRPPFKSATVLGTLEQVRNGEPLAPSRLHANLPRNLETICLKCLRKESGNRFASAAALAQDLRRFLAGQPIHARPASLRSRIGSWSRRPERVTQAGLIMLLFGASFTFWCLLTVILLLWKTIPVEQPGEAYDSWPDIHGSLLSPHGGHRLENLEKTESGASLGRHRTYRFDACRLYVPFPVRLRSRGTL